jgi:chemotaxis protein methyltransferase CheR
MKLDPESLQVICTFIKAETGIELSDDKRYLIEGRLRPILKRMELEGFGALARCIKTRSDNKILLEVIDAATTNETFFFRDVAPFKAIESFIIPEIMKKRTSDITIWSAASSSGQEAYSLAMIITEKFPQLWQKNLRIFASDISEEILDKAREGVYKQLEVNRGLPSPFLVKYFKQEGENWRINNEIRSRVTFFKQNLLTPWNTVPQCDILLLRNVLIYFNLETKKSILHAVRQKLKPDGYFLLGAAETTFNIDPSFKRVPFEGTSVYVKGDEK